MPWRRHLLLAAAFMASACAEIEFGVPSGGSQAGGAGGGPSATGGGGGGPTGEQCLNGVDDDDDGLADCEDDDCAEFACVDLPPGWLGPVELRADDSPCDGAFSEGIASLKSDLSAPPATCSCTCNAGAPSCDEAEIQTFANPLCSNMIDSQLLANGICSVLSDVAPVDSYRLVTQFSSDGCETGVDSELPALTFDARRLCGLPSTAAGCGAEACAPSSTCVYMSGNQVCPTGFGTPFMGNAGVVDSRDCAPGSCNCTGSGDGCSYSLQLFDDTDCTDGPVSSVMSTNCQIYSFSSGNTGSALFTSTADAQVCTPSGTATPTGSVSLSEPITVCCAL